MYTCPVHNSTDKVTVHTMSNKENLALVLARCNKRLRFWSKALVGRRSSTTGSGPVHSGITQITREIETLLHTYALLISKLSKTQNDAEYSETAARIISLERQLTSLFEQSRLSTSEINTGHSPQQLSV